MSNTEVIEQFHGKSAKHFLLSMKPNFSFKSPKTNIFISPVVTLLLLFSQNLVYSFMTDKCKRKMPEAYLLLKDEICDFIFELSAVRS